ncbi:MAG TPA: thymidylate synthase [Rhizobacter sp.]
MKQMHDLFHLLLTTGQRKENRTGVATFGIFGHQMRFHLQGGFPLCTRKFVPFKLVASELLWFLKGEQDKPGAIAGLHADNNHIWDEWAKPDGSFGPIYGVQWRRWLSGVRNDSGDAYYAADSIDQIARLIATMKNNPESRRNIVTAWQPGEIEDMALPPCHVLFQVNCRPVTPGYAWAAEQAGRKAPKWVVDLQLYQRSCDAFLGVPFNIASYALLLHLLCHCAGEDYIAGDFVWTGGDVHLYENHLSQAKAYIHNEEHPLPLLAISADAPRDIDKIELGHLALLNYQHSGVIKADVAV